MRFLEVDEVSAVGIVEDIVNVLVRLCRKRPFGSTLDDELFLQNRERGTAVGPCRRIIQVSARNTGLIPANLSASFTMLLALAAR